jgi:hypothetical protein
VRRAPLVVLVLLPLLTGCGVSADRDRARAVTDRFLGAVARGDGAVACDLVTDDLRAAVEKQGPCPVEIRRHGLRGTRASTVKVYVLSGQARTNGGQTAFLDKVREGWRLAAVGCRPTAPDEPYDCALED